MYLFIFILCTFMFKPTNNISLNEIIVPKYQYTKFISYFINLLQNYRQYDRIYHMDTSSYDIFDEIISQLRRTTKRYPFAIYNYDKMKNCSRIKRSKSVKIVHVIYTNNHQYWKIFMRPYKISYNDVAIFIKTDESSTDLYEEAEIVKLAGKVLLIEVKYDVFLYEICHYCGNSSRQLIPIIEKPTLQKILPNNFTDFNKHELYLVFIPNYPYIYCKEFQEEIYQNTSMTLCTKLGGIESHMIKIISKKMNFTFKAYTLEAENANYMHMLTYINTGKMDLAFGSISLTLNRRNLSQFTLSYNVENFCVMYKVSLSFMEELKKFFDPFSDLLLWILFLIVQFLLLGLLRMIQKLEKQRREKTLIECFWLLLQIQLEQSIPPSTSHSNSSTTFTISKNSPPLQGIPSNRFYSKYSSALLLLWCLTCLVLCSAYKGMTLSSLLRPPKTEPERLSDLFERGYIIAASYKSTDIVLDLLYGHPGINVYFGKSICDVYSKVQTSKLGLINEWTILQLQLTKYCPRPPYQVKNAIRIARYPVRSAGHAWATQPGAAYKPALDYYLSLVLSGGLYVKWTRDKYFENGGSQPFRLSRETHKHMHASPLPLEAFYSLFIIYFFGILFACILFTAELLCHYKLQVKKVLYPEIKI